MTTTKLTRRAALSGVAGLALTTALPLGLKAQPLPVLEITKTPTCGCCGAWSALARKAGFPISVTDTDDYEGMKRDAVVPEHLWSCHTAKIDGYVIEGHVPFAAIKALLRDRPNILGLSVPGMPAESPGMDGGVDAVVPVVAWGGEAGAGVPFSFDAR